MLLCFQTYGDSSPRNVLPELVLDDKAADVFSGGGREFLQAAQKSSLPWGLISSAVFPPWITQHHWLHCWCLFSGGGRELLLAAQKSGLPSGFISSAVFPGSHNISGSTLVTCSERSKAGAAADSVYQACVQNVGWSSDRLSTQLLWMLLVSVCASGSPCEWTVWLWVLSVHLWHFSQLPSLEGLWCGWGVGGGASLSTPFGSKP